jgi:hypothetical protein
MGCTAGTSAAATFPWSSTLKLPIGGFSALGLPSARCE